MKKSTTTFFGILMVLLMALNTQARYTDLPDFSGTAKTVTAVPFTVTPPLSATIDSKTDVSCHGGDGMVIITATNGMPPYTYSSTPFASWSVGVGGALASNLSVGIYNVTVTDANHQTAMVNVVITPNLLDINLSQTNVSINGGADGSATANVTGGTPPYSYNWAVGMAVPSNVATVSGLTAGTYSVTITDAKNCTAAKIFTITEPAPPKVIYVKADATGSTNNGTSWANAYTNLQDAINASAAGDSIFVAQGTYTGNFTINNGIKLYGNFVGTESSLTQRNLSSTNTTTLDGNNSGIVLTNETSGVVIIDGFTFKGGNTTVYGGGIYNHGGTLTVANSIISGNSASAEYAGGGGIDNGGGMLTLINSTVSGNSAGSNGNGNGGGILNTGTVSIINSIISGNNSAGFGGGIYNGSIFGNVGKITLTNSIVWGNTAGNTNGIFNNGTLTATYSDVQGGVLSGDGNISEDPLFVNAPVAGGVFTNGDYHLKIGSPAIGTGNNATVPSDITTDLAGNARTQKGTVDMGAFESPYGPALVPGNHVIYVSQTGKGNFTGNSWDNATDDIQNAINASIAGDSVFVAQGTYQPASGQYFSMKESVKIYGGFEGDEISFSERNLTAGNSSILKGNGNSVIYNNNNGLDTSAVLDGFIITGGSASRGGGMHNYSSSPTVSNCIFLGNTASSLGGGMGIEYSTSYAVVVNCIFSGNSAGYFGGGGICNNYNASSVEVINCTFSGNTSLVGGNDIISVSSSTVVTNSIMSSNDAVDSYNGGWPIITYSLVQGGFTGTGNIDANPSFVNASNPVGADGIWGTADDGFRLQAISPAINKGNNDSIPAGITTDIAGNTRIYGGVIDMGAYENQLVVLPVSLLSFTAKASGDRALLQWQTASEQNNSTFVVYRSGDDGLFAPIDEKAGVGTSTTAHSYSFYDASPLNGTNYYRLVQVDNDGKETDLGVRQVSFELSALSLQLYPNPTVGTVYAQFEAGVYHSATLINLNGAVLNKKAINKDDTLLDFDLSALPAGVYIIKLNGEKENNSRRVVKR